MSALTLSDIVVAINNSNNCICHPLIKAGSVFKFNGRPICYSGNYGAVFKYNTDNGIKALRVWTKDLAYLTDIAILTKLISKQISNIQLTCFTHFEYIEKGILAKGEYHPILVMDWCEGLNLKEYISVNRNNSTKLSLLADNFLTIIKALHSKRISHGDLQHGNIIINKSGNIKLIDYDSMYFDIPEFKQKIETIKGLPDYQHPNRSNNKYLTYKADYFSELIIYISIRAIMENPTLWEKYHVDSRDYSLLFDVSDYSALQSSNIYKDLQLLSPQIQELLSILCAYIAEKDINNLNPFYYNISYLQDKSLYCINCGNKFYNFEDAYCIKCGAKRL